MGLTKNLGALPRAITVDSSNNVGVGSALTVNTDGGFGAGRTSNNAGSTVVNIIGSSQSSTSAQLNLTQVWNGVSYPVVLRNTYNTIAGAASSVFTLSTSQYNGSIGGPELTERFRIDGYTGNVIMQNSLSIGGAAVGLSGINMVNQNYLAWYASGGTGAQYVALRGNGSNLELSSGGGLTMTMDSAQRVGIGTGVPYSKVHIEGLFGTSGDALRIQNTTAYATGNRSNIDFWFKSAAWTNSRTAQIAAVNTELYWPSTDITFSTSTFASATGLKEVMRIKQDGAVSNNGVLTQYASGSASVLNTFYFDFVAYPSTAYKVIAGMTHWNAAYGAYKECVQFNDSYTNISELSITNHTSAAGGSWAISRPNSTTLRVTHNGGNYDGGANFWIQVIGV